MDSIGFRHWYGESKELWCDMGHSITGRGYMRFWWYGTWYAGDSYVEQQSDFFSGQFGIADISNIDKM